MAFVAFAGVFGNAFFALLLAVVGAACIAAGYIDDIDRLRSPGYEIVTKGMFYSLFSMLMHLIPIPPADGSRIVGAFLPAPIRRIYYSVAPIGGLLIIVVMLWATGFLYKYFPKVGIGYARELSRFQEWSFDRIDQLAAYFGA
jgi:Zn-dependent protease